MNNVVLLQYAPNRENALKFTDFLLELENITAVSNYARYGTGVAGVEEFLDPALATLPEANLPASVGAPVLSKYAPKPLRLYMIKSGLTGKNKLIARRGFRRADPRNR